MIFILMGLVDVVVIQGEGAQDGGGGSPSDGSASGREKFQMVVL